MALLTCRLLTLGLALGLAACSSSNSAEGGDPPMREPDPLRPATTPRSYTWRALGGVSMGGGSALQLALQFPERFDFVGALGGYHDLSYMMMMIEHFHAGGFCPRETLLEVLAEDPAKLNEIIPGRTDCGPVKARDISERDADWNHIFWFDGFDRDGAMRAFQDVALAWGNPMYYNPEHPYLPPGVPAERLSMDRSNRCNNPVVLENFHHAEFNPDGSFPVITFCDGEEPLEPGQEKWEAYGEYDPTKPHGFPVEVLLAVDYNRNGLRDYGEPVIMNHRERFMDVGTDGCASELEDGQGGCTDAAASPFDADSNPDPNGDDYHWEQNPGGLERNQLWDEGEAYDDFGLDGVADTDDFGEGDGSYTLNPRLANWYEHDSFHLAQSIPKAELDALDIWMDGGIYDGFNHGMGNNHVLSAFAARDIPVEDFPGFLSLPGAGDRIDTFATREFLDVPYNRLPRHTLIRYGDPNATLDQIRDGEGGHVGSALEATSRFMTLFGWLSARWPGGDFDEPVVYPDLSQLTIIETYQSEVLGAERKFGLFLPPAYHEDPEEDFPLLVFLHGLGMDPIDMMAAALPSFAFQLSGKLQKFIAVFPDGRCCFTNRETGEKDCLGEDAEGNSLRDPWIRDCKRGSFYADAAGTVNGEGPGLPYAQSVIELMDYISANYRVRAPSDVMVGDDLLPVDKDLAFPPSAIVDDNAP